MAVNSGFKIFFQLFRNDAIIGNPTGKFDKIYVVNKKKAILDGCSTVINLDGMDICGW